MSKCVQSFFASPDATNLFKQFCRRKSNGYALISDVRTFRAILAWAIICEICEMTNASLHTLGKHRTKHSKLFCLNKKEPAIPTHAT